MLTLFNIYCAIGATCGIGALLIWIVAILRMG